MTTPRAWATIALPEWKPETLPGYAEAKAKVERGEPLFAPQPVSARSPRPRRTLADLTDERNRLTAKRDGLGNGGLPDDPGALSGIRRKRARADSARDRKTDADLERFTAITKRIDYLDYRIRKETA